MKYKVGDIVKIKNSKDFDFTRKFMNKFSGKIMTIHSKGEGHLIGKYYLMKGFSFAIFDAEIECLASEYSPIETRFEIMDL